MKALLLALVIGLVPQVAEAHPHNIDGGPIEIVQIIPLAKGEPHRAGCSLRPSMVGDGPVNCKPWTKR